MIMKPGGTPAFRAAATSILKSFLNTTETAVERKAEVNFLKVDIDPILAKTSSDHHRKPQKWEEHTAAGNS